MAKVKITGHASGTGVLTVTAPNTSSDRTITLPDATGTLLNSDGDGSSLTGMSVAGINSSANADAIVISSDEEVTMPKQPGFYAWLNGDLSNVTGDSTVYSIAGTWSEITDQNADFSNGIFTAPVTGTYIFYCNISLSGMTSAFNMVSCWLQTNNRNHRWYYNGFTAVGAWPVALHNGVIIADMDASDTAQMKVNVAGGTKVIEVEGNSQSQQTNFGGWLLG